MKIPRLMIAGVTSGVGKTSVTCAIIYGLQKLGYSVQPFKVGPDYIDPSYLESISSKSCYNLDFWLMGKKNLIQSFIRNSNSNISIIEGVMGYYDGFSGDTDYSSSFHVSQLLNTPTILVLDASKAGGSVAAIARGFLKYKKNSNIAGVIVNKVGSKRHEIICKDALEKIKIPVIGVIPREDDPLESRHLGLIPAIEQYALRKKIQTKAKRISEFINFESIVKITKKPRPLNKIPSSTQKSPNVTVGVALDSSFNFYYRDNLWALKKGGAEIKFFSPISNEAIPDCDGMIIGGGFPEVLGKPLSANRKMLKSIRTAAQNEMPIYAECGGLMYFTKSISFNSKKYKMIGLVDAETEMTKKMTLNYTRGSILTSNLIGLKGKPFHGHEFHYSKLSSISKDTKFAYKLDIGEGIKDSKDGVMVHNTLASYGHFYFDSTQFVKNFLKLCKEFSRN